MSFEEFLPQLKEELALSHLEKKKDGRCVFTVNGQRPLVLEPSIHEGVFFLYAVICEVVQESELQVLREALSANLFFKKTGQASLGYDIQLGMLVLFQRFEQRELTAKKLAEEVRAFAQQLLYWAHRFEGGALPIDEAGDTERHTFDLKDHRMRVFFA